MNYTFLTEVQTLIPSLVLFVFVYFLNDSHSGCSDIKSQYGFSQPSISKGPGFESRHENYYLNISIITKHFKAS